MTADAADGEPRGPNREGVMRLANLFFGLVAGAGAWGKAGAAPAAAEHGSFGVWAFFCGLSRVCGLVCGLPPEAKGRLVTRHPRGPEGVRDPHPLDPQADEHVPAGHRLLQSEAHLPPHVAD